MTGGGFTSADKETVKIERALNEGPLFLLLRRLTSGPNGDSFVRDTHRESGVISSVALLSPVESCNPPELVSSRLGYTPEECRAQEEKKKN